VSEAGRLEAFDREIAQYDFLGHWGMKIPRNAEPCSRLQPKLWRWKLLREKLMQAGELITVDEAGRRTLGLVNPGLYPQKSTTHTLQMSIQLVLPGEVATAHRHTMAAIRFVVEGKGAFTTVDGNSFLMEPGDLILTPNWTWHDHINESGAPIIWIDGLDVPFSRAMDIMFIEDYEKPRQAVQHVLKTSAAMSAPAASAWYYKWGDVDRSLGQMKEQIGGAGTDLVFDYKDAKGGPTLPTIACGVHVLRRAERTKVRRRTSSGVFHVVRGRGRTIVGDSPLEWESGDFFVVPNWSWHHHENLSTNEDAALFFMSDRPLLEPFGLYREEFQG
jgi:gentisate 1,2-dioxygenase